MAVKTEWIRYGTRSGYFARPEQATPPLPSILVIQEAWGVNEHIEDVTRRFAASGYAALAPDLYSENGQRSVSLTRERISEIQDFISRLPPAIWGDQNAREVELNKLPEADRSRIGETVGAVFGSSGRLAGYIAPLREAVRYLRSERPETKDQPVACVGFCMGGGLSALLACEEPELSGAAVFYGTTPPPEKVALVNCPIYAFYGSADARVNAGIPAFEQGMKEVGKPFEYHLYDGAGHSFFNDTRGSYNVNAARDSFARALSFFSQILTKS
jgi:carboxymethylenebutenolidase